MQFPGNFNLKPVNILKMAALGLVGVVVIVVVFRLVSSSFNSLSSKMPTSQSAWMYNNDEMYDKAGEMAYGDGGGNIIGLSTRNIVGTAPSSMPNPMDSTATTGDDAEEFEVTEYSVDIETRRLENVCNKIAALKSREDVIFENVGEYERNCHYSFKVKSNSVSEILAIIEALDPKELNENTYTIKRLIDDYTSEVEILEKKMNAIEETLANAVSAYDDITRLATKTQDVESLAKIIDSKIRIIERLTQERININAQLERLSRSKSEQLDRLDYIYFNVSVVENKFIDWQNLKDSWKMTIKSFVRDINKIIQDITIKLAVLLFLILKYTIYFFIILIVAKYGWKLAKNIWLR